MASIEHKFSSGYCWVYPDLLDAAGIELRRPPCAAADLFSVTHEVGWLRKCFGGLAFLGTAVHLCDPAVGGNVSAAYVALVASLMVLRCTSMCLRTKSSSVG